MTLIPLEGIIIAPALLSVKRKKKKRNKTSLSVSVRMSVQFLSSVFLWSISIRRGEAQCNEERRGGEEKEGERVQSAEE